jgi:M6 family metalloprotease-like protein
MLRLSKRVSAKGSLRLAGLVALSLVTIVITCAPPAEAVKAYPNTITRYQPDGTPIEVRMLGDERMVFHETESGYTILRRTDGWWVYADEMSNGQAALVRTDLRVGRDELPADWRRHVRPKVDMDHVRIPWRRPNDGSIRDLFLSHGYQTSGAAKAVNPTPISLPVLVVMVEFADWAHTTTPGTPLPSEPGYEPVAGQLNSAATWQELFGDPTIAGGLNHYFDEVSYGQFQWQVEVAQNGLGSGQVVNDGWYVNPQTMAYWGTDRRRGSSCSSDSANARIYQLTQWAIAAADPDVDFAKYDTNGDGQISDAELMVFVIHARPGQEHYGDDCWGDDPEHHIWSHQWVLFSNVTVDGVTFPSSHSYSMNPEFEPGLDRATTPYAVIDKWFGVGVYAHEGMHTLGSPDLYDYDYDANVAGDWDLMDNGSYNGAKSGTHPSHMGTPLKYDIELSNSTSSFGWIFAPDVVELYQGGTHAEGLYRIDALGGSSRANVMHRVIAPNDSSEWFVLENRAAVGYYEPYLPEHGLLVWHRDVNGSRDDWPYAAAVERKGWDSTASGLNAGDSGAAFSFEDGQTELTTTTDPSTALNNGSPSGMLDVRCIGAETSSIPYAYGTISGTDIDYAGSTIVDTAGDADGYLDNGETVTLSLAVLNADCATTDALGVDVELAVAADSDVPATAVTILPSKLTLGDIAVGTQASGDFSVTLACDAAGYAGRTITFAYTITGTNIATLSGTFAKELDKDYLYSDDFEVDTMGMVWTGTMVNEVSSCTSAVGHGEWIWSADRAHSGSRSYHTPEQATDMCYENPEESLVSPNLSIPAGAGLRELRFWHAADIPCPGYTRGRVWVSSDGGATWTRIDGFYKDAGDLSWEETAVNLGAYSEAAQFRFKFVMYTYECWSGCAATEGWYIDDVRVLIDEKDGCS